MSQLETAMAMLMRVFDQYAEGEGKKDTLTNAEAKKLVENELPGLIKAAKNPGDVDKLLKSMDFDGDAEIDFKEFVLMVVALTCACHDRPCKK